MSYAACGHGNVMCIEVRPERRLGLFGGGGVMVVKVRYGYGVVVQVEVEEVVGGGGIRGSPSSAPSHFGQLEADVIRK